VRTIKLLALCAGFLLLGLNVAGSFIPLRSPDLQNEPGGSPELTAPQWEAFSRTRQEPVKDYVTRLTNLVQRSTVNYWKDEGIDKYHLRVPVYENYLLFIASYLKPNEYRKYEFCDYQKAVDRAVGLCSQRAIILAQILRRNGVHSGILGLEGHVVVSAQVDQDYDIWWVADPDYGVVIKRPIAEIQRDSEIIKPSYSARGYDAETIRTLAMVYTHPPTIQPSAKEYRTWKVYYFEYFSYVLIWIIPVALICPAIWPLLCRFFHRLD
jgi:hypothetical protein